jgi:8-oxo-dGTP diphosphatase
MKKVSVVSAIIVREGKLLAAQRGYGDYAGWWEFPGGKVEPGEKPEEALRREIREELAVEISIDRYFDATEYDYDSFYLVMDCYLCSLADGEEISLLEHRAAEWVGAERARTLKWLAADIPIVEKLIEQGESLLL